MACKNLYNYPGFICVDQNTSSQALTSTGTLFDPTVVGQSDVYAGLEWISGGTVTMQSAMRNIMINVSLVLSGAASTDITDIVLFVNGVQTNVLSEFVGLGPNAVFYYPRLNKGDTIQIYVYQYQNKALDGSAGNRLFISGNI